MAIQVFRQKIWMRKYGVPSWKATMLWSNSWHVQKLDLGAMTKEEKAESVPLAKTYTDKRGKKRCVGKKKTMKESQILAWYSSCFSTCLQAFFSICDLACIFRRIFIQIHQTHIVSCYIYIYKTTSDVNTPLR